MLCEYLFGFPCCCCFFSICLSIAIKSAVKLGYRLFDHNSIFTSHFIPQTQTCGPNDLKMSIFFTCLRLVWWFCEEQYSNEHSAMERDAQSTNFFSSSDCFHFIFDSRVFFSVLFQSSHFHRIVAVFSLIYSVCVHNKCMCKFVGVFLFGFWLLQAIIVLSEVARIRISGARPIDFKHISALVMKSNFFFRLAKS